MKVAFRADSSLQIGSGHVMRCLTLADELARRGATTHFIVRDLPGNLASLIRRRGHECTLLRAPSVPLSPVADGAAHAAWLGVSIAEEIADTDSALSALGVQDWLVVDHYALDAAWERQSRRWATRLLVIDDLADRLHDCDLLLDQNLFPAAAARYADRVPAGCRTLLGPRFALLRPEFRSLRRREGERPGALSRVLVFLGGADPQNATATVLRALDAFPSLAVDLVSAASHPGAAGHAAWCSGRERAVLHQPSDCFPDLLAAADLAIGAGGATSWERCCLGVPSVVISIAGNQHAVARHAAEAGAQIYLGLSERVGAEDIAAAIRCLLASAGLRVALAKAGRALVDGLGVKRVADAMVPGSRVTLRAAVAGDAETLFRWRNDPVTRQHFFDPSPILPERHMEWLSRTLADPARVLLVGEDRRGPLGSIRYDLRGNEAEVSVYLAPERRGEGLGAALIGAGSQWVRSQCKSVKRLTARVLPANEASARAFGDAGYTETCRDYVIEL